MMAAHFKATKSCHIFDHSKFALVSKLCTIECHPRQIFYDSKNTTSLSATQYLVDDDQTQLVWLLHTCVCQMAVVVPIKLTNSS